MTLHRDPPAPDSVTPVEPPAPFVDVRGRWSWPGVLHYEIEGDPDVGGGCTSAYPPSEHEPMTVTMRRPEAQRDMSPAARAARTPPYRMVVLPGKTAEVDALRRAGWLQDPRHTGVESEIVDGRKAPGA